MKIIKLHPVLVPKIWGGTLLKEKYDINTDLDNIGELWAISAINNYSNQIADHNTTLVEYYRLNKNEFKINDDVFPLLVKILDAKEDLSVQVHPGDDYALKKHDSLGKNECWYIMDLKDNDEIVYGSNVANKEALRNAIYDNDFNKIMRTIKIQPGDFLDVPVGMIHAIKGGSLIYELQQSSDITYRLYDYERLENGKKRELHLEDSINVVRYENLEKNINITKYNDNHYNLINNKYFVLDKLEVSESYQTSFNMPFLLITVIKGSGMINDETIAAGSSLIVTNYNNDKITFSGLFEVMIASSKTI